MALRTIVLGIGGAEERDQGMVGSATPQRILGNFRLSLRPR
jgi:hypothetical protein